MKINKLILGLSSLGLLATATPISFVASNQVTFADSQNMQMQSLEVGSKLTEIKSINKSCEKLVSFKLSEEVHWKIDEWYSEEYISNIDSRIKIEDGNEPGVKDGKIDRDDLFICERINTQYASYQRYKSNNVEKNSHTSWGNAKKYQLNVTVPANTKEYKVQVVADVKIKNCLNGGFDETYSFAQAKLSQLSTNPKDTLMPYMGIKDNNKYKYHNNKFKLTTQNDLFRLFRISSPWGQKPYEKAKLSSAITLANKTPEAKEIPIYFWYGFIGGGYSGEGHGSHINCSEVTFSANHIE